MTVKETPHPGGQPIVFDRPCVLLVEGPDDRAFAARQIEVFDTRDRWHVHHMEGNSTDWTGILGVILNSDPFQDSGFAIGIVLDSDLNPAAAADKAKGHFRDAGLPVPTDHAAIARGQIRTGFFLMPNGEDNGALEELLLEGVEGSRRALAESYIENVSETFVPPKKPRKAVVQAYFAGQVDHVKSIPVAVRKVEVVDPNATAFDAFRKFLKDLSE